MSLPVFLLFTPHPFFASCLLVLAGGFLAFFLGQKRWVLASCCITAFCLALLSQHLIFFSPAFLGFVGITVLGLLFYHRSLKQPWPYIIFFVILAATAAIIAHKVPGVANWLVVKNIRLSAHALPWNFWINFDKPLLALILLTAMPSFGICLSLTKSTRYTVALSLLAAAFMVGGAFYFGYVAYAPKLPSITLLWLFANILLVCPAEEVIFRGFIQKGLIGFFKRNQAMKDFAAPVSLGVTSILFGVAHLAGGPVYVSLATIAGLFYGLAVHITGRLGAAVAVHATVNTLHFFFFTYPALKGAF